MMAQRLPPRYLRTPLRQRGQAALIIALLISAGIVALVFATSTSTANSIANREARNVEKELARVKEALIGWSASRTPTGGNPNARPGELPCPDTDNNGYAENDDNNDGVDTASCPAGSIGRVPWKTLGIPEPKDGAGETLWYAISGNFRVYRNVAPNIYTSAITSDTVGTLTVYQDSTANTITTQAVAVIFAPGAAVGTQDRSSTTTMSCSAPSGTYLRNQCASNYLETLGGVNNSGLNGPFIRGAESSTFNDRLLVITNDDLMPVVEQRVARELIAWLNLYKAATGTSLLFQLIPLSPGVYPWADLGDGDSNATSGAAYNRNRFPCGTAAPVDWNASMGIPPLLGTGTTPALPNWLTNGCGNPPTGWSSVIYYAVARNKLEQATLLNLTAPTCSTCTAATLNVTNPGGTIGTVCSDASPPVCSPQIITPGSADLLLIMPGARTDGRGPPGPATNDWPTNAWDTISASYFSDTGNRDNNDDDYVVPSSSTFNRNRIYVVR